VDWALYRPILLYGPIPAPLRTQYSTQYNLNIQRELTKDLVLQVGYVGSQGIACWPAMTSTLAIRRPALT